MNTGAALLQTLTGRGVVLTADAGKLRYKAPAGTMTPDLRRQLEAHKAALVALLSAQQVGLFDASAPDLGAASEPDSRLITGSAPELGRPLVAGLGHAIAQDMPKARPTYGQDFARARQLVADLAAELDGLLAELGQAPGRGLEFAKPDHVAHAAWLRFCELDSRWARLAPVAEYATFEELEAATGAAYLAAVANKSDQALAMAYARLDDAWAAVLELPEVQS